MRRRSLMLLLATSGCDRAPVGEFAFGRALVGVARGSGQASEAQAGWCLGELQRIAELAREGLSRRRDASPAAILSELLFGRLGFVREVDDKSLDFVVLPSVLKRRRGSCVGLGTLFLALAEGLGWSAKGVMMPGRFYVRVREPSGTRNVELLRAGEAMPDAWYERRFPVPGGSAREYARPLAADEVLAVVEYNLGNQRRRQRRLVEARSAFARAARLFPDFAEAHASLGAVEQLLGDLEGAAASYRHARAANPGLPGLAENVALLEAERELGR